MPEHPDTLIWVAGVKPALEDILYGFATSEAKACKIKLYIN